MIDNEHLLFSATLYCSGFRYIVDHEDDMMRIAYREDGQDDKYNAESDILIAWEDAESLGQAITQLAQINKRRND